MEVVIKGKKRKRQAQMHLLTHANYIPTIKSHLKQLIDLTASGAWDTDVASAVRAGQVSVNAISGGKTDDPAGAGAWDGTGDGDETGAMNGDRSVEEDLEAIVCQVNPQEEEEEEEAVNNGHTVRGGGGGGGGGGGVSLVSGHQLSATEPIIDGSGAGKKDEQDVGGTQGGALWTHHSLHLQLQPRPPQPRPPIQPGERNAARTRIEDALAEAAGLDISTARELLTTTAALEAEIYGGYPGKEYYHKVRACLAVGWGHRV